ncbi:MAG: SAM-dependent methyltransferase [Lachnospiraceae bacterium]|nr:SAM-dependent methyltransferase [Lachnospiraceae bacterium]
MAQVKLSPRMQAIADMADGKVAADIGCDHAFVSINLIKEKGFEKVIAMDVRKGPLEIAKKNISLYEVGDKIDIRLSDGFDGLALNEADTAIIAGMGGELMVDILKRGKIHTDNDIALILQPQSEPEKVRKYILDIGYKITDEVMLIDEEKYYVVIKADKREKSDDKPYNHSELLYGRILIEKKDIILKEYLEKQLDKNNKLIISLEAAGTEHALRKIQELRQEEYNINDVLNKIA